MSEPRKQAARPEGLKAPIIKIGVVEWMRKNLFNGVFNSILTIVTLFFLYKVVPPFVRWAFIDSLWFSTADECRAGVGACWSLRSPALGVLS